MPIINAGKTLNLQTIYAEIKLSVPSVMPKLSGIDDENGVGFIRLKTELTPTENTGIQSVIAAHDPSIAPFEIRNSDILRQIADKEAEAMRGIIELNVDGRGARPVPPADIAASRARVDAVYDELAALRALLT